MAQQTGHQKRGALFATPPVLWEAFYGDASEAKSDAAAILERPHGRETEYGAALALALSRDSVHSEALASDLEKQYPDDTSVRFSYLPTVRAVLALSHGEAEKAIELLQAARPPMIWRRRAAACRDFSGRSIPVYVRGEAYLAAARSGEAITEFQKILGHRGIVVSDPIGALVHPQLGRAYALGRDDIKARASYQDFLALRKDADPDIPMLK